MNCVTLIGRLTKDPEIKKAQNTTVARMNVAIQRIGRDGVDYVNVVAFGNTAEAVGKYIKKGSQIGVTGKITTGSYEKDGRKVYTTDVFADKVEFLATKKPEEKQEPIEGFAQTDEDIPF